MHLGRDFASYQGDLSPADCAGIDFAFVKITEGSNYKNPYAVQQCQALRAAGVHVGYYHFWDPGVPILDQLHNFHLYASTLGTTPLPLALDSETADPLGFQNLASEMMQFAMNVESWSNWVPNPRSIFYTDLAFANALPGFPWGRWVWLADPSHSAPSRPCLIWQTAPRPVSGTDLKVVDPDQFMGTEADWAAFTGQGVYTGPPPPPPPTPVTIYPEVEMQPKLTITLPVPLDTNGHGWYTFASVGLPTTATITNITPLGGDPSSEGYSNDAVVRAFDYYLVPGKPEFVVYGSPGARYAVQIDWHT
jgi:hypothetical protein